MNDSVAHGTASTYNNHGCRCEPCKEAWSKYQWDLRERRRLAEGEPIKSRTRGGTGAQAYNAACRALQRRHPEEWEQLLKDMRALRGL